MASKTKAAPKISAEAQAKADQRNPFKNELSFSKLKIIDRSPADFKFQVENPEEKEDTPALIFGKLFHTMVLEPNKVESLYWVLDITKRPELEKTMASTKNKEWKAAQYEKNEGKTLVTSEEMTIAKGMQKSVMEQAGDFITNATAYEREIHWVKRGVKMKGFIDGDHPLYMFDLKTAINAEPEAWMRKAFYDYRSDMQAAIYLDGDGEGIWKGEKEFYFIVVEKKPPYLCSVIRVSPERIRDAMFKYVAALEKLKACRKNNEWPHFYKEVFEWN